MNQSHRIEIEENQELEVDSSLMFTIINNGEPPEEENSAQFVYPSIAPIGKDNSKIEKISGQITTPFDDEFEVKEEVKINNLNLV